MCGLTHRPLAQRGDDLSSASDVLRSERLCPFKTQMLESQPPEMMVLAGGALGRVT